MLAVLVGLALALGSTSALARARDPGVGQTPPGTARGDGGDETVLVPAGEFWMGSDTGPNDEKPRRRIYLDAYRIDRFTVTNARYRRFLRATGRSEPSYWGDSDFNGASQPVVGVDWYDAEAYCQWSGKRLPTEAEWEKAARGSDGRKYPWGEQWDSSRANSRESNLDKTAPVGAYPGGASPYGALDMAGNVWQWVSDWYDAGYYKRSPERNPQGPERGKEKVLRGGSWTSFPSYLRAAARDSNTRVFRYHYVGFRCAKRLP